MKAQFGFLIALISVLFSAQTIIAHYDQVQVKKVMDETFEDGPEAKMDKEEMEELQAFMNQPNKFTLIYSNGISNYEEDEIPEDQQSREMNFGDENGKVSILVKRTKSEDQWYKDFNQQEVIAAESIFDKMFLMEEPMNIIDWKIEEEEKQIGDFLCKKATANFKGEMVTAYYSDDIPIPDGPKLYYGLPGLILELQGENFQYVLTSLSMTQDNTEMIKPENGKKIARDKFEKLKEEKYKQTENGIIMHGF